MSPVRRTLPPHLRLLPFEPGAGLQGRLLPHLTAFPLPTVPVLLGYVLQKKGLGGAGAVLVTRLPDRYVMNGLWLGNGKVYRAEGTVALN
jgi:hypothetical protein